MHISDRCDSSFLRRVSMETKGKLTRIIDGIADCFLKENFQCDLSRVPVKLVAFSTEFSIRPQRERLNQGSDTVKSPQLTSLAGAEKPWVTQIDKKSQGVHFNFEPGGTKSSDIRNMNKKYVTKSQVKINPAFDTCKHMVALLETSKWKDIQKTLHWLNRALALSSNNLKSCRGKFGKTKSKFRLLNEMLSFSSTKINSKSKNYFQPDHFSGKLIMSGRRNLINSCFNKPRNVSEPSERLKNECEHKYKLKKNKLKHLYQKKSRRKTKNRKYSHKKIVEKRRHYTDRPARPSNTTMKPKNAFSNFENLYYENKNEVENSGGEKFAHRKSGFKNTVKIFNNLEEKLENLEKITNQGFANKEKNSDFFNSNETGHFSDGKNYKKENPWPNFVYHRVSSDLFHLGSTASNHKQSAYVAISVNTSGVPETNRKKKLDYE